jgi:hypothetical protein
MAGTVAGTGVGGYAGDGGPAASAQFNFPTGMARDAQSNLYVADSANSVVRKFSVGGNISTVAGTGTQGYSGDGGPATQAQLAFPIAVAVDNAGNLYIAGKSQSHPSPGQNPVQQYQSRTVRALQQAPRIRPVVRQDELESPVFQVIPDQFPVHRRIFHQQNFHERVSRR